MKLWQTALSVLIIICSTAFAWRHMIYTADTVPAFYNDEIPNVSGRRFFFFQWKLSMRPVWFILQQWYCGRMAGRSWMGLGA